MSTITGALRTRARALARAEAKAREARKARDQTIREAVKSGMTGDEVGEHVGLSRMQVSVVARAARRAA